MERMKFHYYSRSFKKLELGMETTFQLAGNIILIALASSETKTSQALAAVFEEGNFFIIPVYYMIALSMGISFFSFMNSQISGLAGHRVYFPFKCRTIPRHSGFPSQYVLASTSSSSEKTLSLLLSHPLLPSIPR